MNIKKIHGFFIPGHIPLTLLILGFILFRFLHTEEGGSLEFWGLMTMQTGTAFLLLYLNRAFIIIRRRTLLPVFFYLLFTGLNPAYHCTWSSGIASLCVLLFFIFLFSTSRQSYPQGNAFNIALILTLGSFVWQPLLFFFLVLWLGSAYLHELNFRSFFGSLTGFAVIYLFIFTGSIYLGDNPDIFMDKLPDLRALFQFRPLEGFTRPDYMIAGALFVLFIVAGSNIFSRSISENTKTIVSLSFLYIVTFFVFVFLFLQPQWKNEWFSILCLPLSLLVAHLFSMPSRWLITWLMLLSIAFFLTVPFLK
ncbi:MAG: DUF6427 family protein [Dysgonamonadaceae bacterium]|jgi:hypothetical protein|nr:DUF6427 family protein [Dysgonamonadaceae bacterium]